MTEWSLDGIGEFDTTTDDIQNDDFNDSELCHFVSPPPVAHLV